MTTKYKNKVEIEPGIVGSHGEIITASGIWVNVFDPDLDSINIEDIAHALSNQCRFTGHTSEFYSVAQHSILVSMETDPQYSLQGLLHDASEAYLSDIARPIKKHPDFGPFYENLETTISNAIMDKYGLPRTLHPSVKQADDRLLISEAEDLMPPSFPRYEGERISYAIFPWHPSVAKERFLGRFEYLSKAGGAA